MSMVMPTQNDAVNSAARTNQPGTLRQKVPRFWNPLAESKVKSQISQRVARRQGMRWLRLAESRRVAILVAVANWRSFLARIKQYTTKTHRIMVKQRPKKSYHSGPSSEAREVMLSRLVARLRGSCRVSAVGAEQVPFSGSSNLSQAGVTLKKYYSSYL